MDEFVLPEEGQTRGQMTHEALRHGLRDNETRRERDKERRREGDNERKGRAHD